MKTLKAKLGAVVKRPVKFHHVEDGDKTFIYRHLSRPRKSGVIATLIGYMQGRKKHLYAIIAAVAMLYSVGAMVGCTTGATNTTVKVEVGLIPSVNVAMSVWKSHVEAGKATQEQVDNVKAMYETYYASQIALKAALIKSIETKLPADEAAATIAANSMRASQAKLISTVQTLTK